MTEGHIRHEHGYDGDADHEPGFADLLLSVFRFLWGARLWMFGGLALALLLSVGIFLFMGLLKPTATSYRNAIILTMVGNQDGKYTSGLTYSPNDLRSPAVLAQVFDANHIANYGITLEDFSASISVEPYSPTMESTVSRFRDQLSDKKLEPSERARIEEQFRAEMSAAESHGVTVTFAVPDSWGIPRAIGVQVANDVPKVWADVFVNVLGVASISNMRTTVELVDLKRVEDLDYPLGYDYLELSLGRLTQRLNTLASVPVVQNAIVDADSPSIADLQRIAQDFQAINLQKILRPLVARGVTRDPEVTILTYEARIEQLRREEAVAKERAAIVDAARTEDSSNGAAGAGATAGPVAGGAGLQQFDSGFLDRLVGLSVSEAGVLYRQDLLNKQINYSQEATNLAAERAELTERLKTIREFDLSNPQSKRFADRFAVTLREASVEANRLWELSSQLESKVSDSVLATQGRLYRPIPLPDSVETSHFWASAYLWLAIAALIFMLPLTGLALFVFFRYVAPNSFPSRSAT
jgi:hypothetical protein